MQIFTHSFSSNRLSERASTPQLVSTTYSSFFPSENLIFSKNINMSGYRFEYSHDEEQKIVDYIVENNSIHRIKGDQLWKEMEESGVVLRTWQSLKQHFRKKMIYELHYPRYNLSKEVVSQFQQHFQLVSIHNKKKNKKQNQNESERKIPDFTLSSSDSDEEAD